MAELTPDSLLVDCHSFPSDVSDVDICIGVNDHWSRPDKVTLDTVLEHFCDYKVAINDPFHGSLTPEAGFPYTSLMIEVNKTLYLNEETLMESAFAYKLHNRICSLYGKLLAKTAQIFRRRFHKRQPKQSSSSRPRTKLHSAAQCATSEHSPDPLSTA